MEAPWGCEVLATSPPYLEATYPPAVQGQNSYHGRSTPRGAQEWMDSVVQSLQWCPDSFDPMDGWGSPSQAPPCPFTISQSCSNLLP